jgi:hypothetical protein
MAELLGAADALRFCDVTHRDERAHVHRPQPGVLPCNSPIFTPALTIIMVLWIFTLSTLVAHYRRFRGGRIGFYPVFQAPYIRPVSFAGSALDASKCVPDCTEAQHKIPPFSQFLL